MTEEPCPKHPFNLLPEDRCTSCIAAEIIDQTEAERNQKAARQLFTSQRAQRYSTSGHPIRRG